jgi:hypothetical protein
VTTVRATQPRAGRARPRGWLCARSVLPPAEAKSANQLPRIGRSSRKTQSIAPAGGALEVPVRAHSLARQVPLGEGPTAYCGGSLPGANEGGAVGRAPAIRAHLAQAASAIGSVACVHIPKEKEAILSQRASARRRRRHRQRHLCPPGAGAGDAAHPKSSRELEYS